MPLSPTEFPKTMQLDPRSAAHLRRVPINAMRMHRNVIGFAPV